ncbi:Open rectifier potassium channel protein 1 [Frankliniella fusca]|uniref:Open rectifier potassium channel protein 1 n=1 Tax=Frankliniella fusca TaxID=407009 RepID=A0AAE1LE47_9NEOP|nr:Open rectifier potassium channel protein 1 [Frankliniella fusca]
MADSPTPCAAGDSLVAAVQRPRCPRCPPSPTTTTPPPPPHCSGCGSCCSDRPLPHPPCHHRLTSRSPTTPPTSCSCAQRAAATAAIMSGKQFLVLLMLFLAYLMLGAAVFHYIEQAKEIEFHRQQRRVEEEIVSKLHDNLDNRTYDDVIILLTDYCGKSFNRDPNRADPYKWHFYNAVFFVITVVSTIGYGNLAPTTMLSRLLMILYALVGIPMNGILLKSLADYFGHFFLRARKKYRMHQHDGMSLAGSILMYFCLGFFVFIISPSFIFMYFEGWQFDMAIYYAFVSLTTIGFGDLVAGQNPYKTDVSYTLYKVFLIVWLVFGLGYLFMVLGFITDAMRSKRMAKLSKAVKLTQSKLWNGMVHEMPHLMRRVLNELYLLKVKPVYHDDDDSLCSLNMGERCSSCPDLFWLDEGYARTPAHPFAVVVGLPGAGNRRASRAAAGSRPRALSEVVPGRLLARRRSETELARIDRRATFADKAPPTDSALDPAELLHEFMNALVNWGGGGGGVSNDEVYNTMHKAPGTALPNGGYQGFADADILSSEWSQQHRLTRQRAKSLAPFTAATDALAEAHYGYGVQQGYGGGRGGDEDWDQDDSSTLPADEAGHDQDAANNAEWTWSGTGASKRVHELIRARQNRRKSEAVNRRYLRHDRRLQELQDFERLRALEEMRQIAKEARQKEKRLRARTMSTGAAETGELNQEIALVPPSCRTLAVPYVGVGSSAGTASVPRSSVSSLMQRLAIPQRLKDLARRRRSLQPPGVDPDQDADQDDVGPPPVEKRRSPSYDPVTSPWPWPQVDARARSRTESVGGSALGLGLGGAGFDAAHGRRDSIFRRNSATVHPVLENTSLAEFLHVLQLVQRQQGGQSTSPTATVVPATPGKTRKLGTAGLTAGYYAQPSSPNTIFNVFPGLRDGAGAAPPEKRRFSLRPASPPPGQGFGAAAGGAPASGKRRMSFWPSFGSGPPSSDQTQSGAAPAPRRSSTARRLSTFFGAGTCTDPAPDQDDEEVAAPIAVKVTKRRRFSIWPTLGLTGRAAGDADEKSTPVSGTLSAMEDGVGNGGVGNGGVDMVATCAGAGSPMVPQITVTYIDDVPPPAVPPPVIPAPREALRRMALTSNLPTTAPVAAAAAAGSVRGSTRPRHPRASIGSAGAGGVGGLPGPGAARGVAKQGPLPHPAAAAPLPGRRGPSAPSPLSTPVSSFRRRAMSESTRRDESVEDTDSERL